jgi:hypothetical protein
MGEELRNQRDQSEAMGTVRKFFKERETPCQMTEASSVHLESAPGGAARRRKALRLSGHALHGITDGKIVRCDAVSTIGPSRHLPQDGEGLPVPHAASRTITAAGRTYGNPPEVGGQGPSSTGPGIVPRMDRFVPRGAGMVGRVSQFFPGTSSDLGVPKSCGISRRTSWRSRCSHRRPRHSCGLAS